MTQHFLLSAAARTLSLKAVCPCLHHFSVMSGMIFANGAKGVAALHLSRDLNCQYKTAKLYIGKAEPLSPAKGGGVIRPMPPRGRAL